MGSELAVVEHRDDGGAAALAKINEARGVAGVTKEIVTRAAQSIQGRKYVRVDGWQSIAIAYGCAASSRDTKRVLDEQGRLLGVEATGEVRRISDGVVIATAVGFVGVDEHVWFGGGVNPKTRQPYPARPLFACFAMAQTRGISRACRSAFAPVVTFMDAGLETTPAEEMEGVFPEGDRAPPPAPLGVEKLRQAATAPAPKTTPNGSPRRLDLDASEPPPHTDSDAPPMEDAQVVEAPKAADASRPPPVTFRYGRGKDKTSRDVSDADLEWYVAGARKSVEDPEKARFREKNAAELELLQAEQRWRQGGGR